MRAHGIERGFMNAASPGVISPFLQNEHYPTPDAYLAALADAMTAEYGHPKNRFVRIAADMQPGGLRPLLVEGDVQRGRCDRRQSAWMS
jgi:hypothetical protein